MLHVLAADEADPVETLVAAMERRGKPAPLEDKEIEPLQELVQKYSLKNKWGYTETEIKALTQ